MATEVAPRAFPLRPFPRKLARSLIFFAGAGTLMALAVWSDGLDAPALPLAILIACWALPLLFAYQIRRAGFDPLETLIATPEGLEARYRDGNKRFVRWGAVRHLVQIEGFRHRTWAIVSEGLPLRWFGELEDPEGFAELASARTGLAWEVCSKLPDEGAEAPGF